MQEATSFPAYFCNNKYLALGDANSLLGAGGFAYVWKGSRLEDNQPVAIKIMKRQDVPIRLQQQMEAEIALMKQLTHENILQLLDTDKTAKGNLVLILEFCDKSDLQKFLNGQKTSSGKPPRLSIPDTIYFFRQLGMGYGVLRKKDIIHRDIKPDNLLLTKRDPNSDGSKAEDLILKIADFGLAREGIPHATSPKNKTIIGFDFDTEQVTVGQDLALTECGTRAFQAPEIAAGRGYTYKADMWAIGCTLYLCLMGTPYPLKLGLFSEELLQLPEEALNLLQGLLQTDPDNRVSYEEFVWHNFLIPPEKPQSSFEAQKKPPAKTLSTNVRRRSSSSRAANVSPRKHTGPDTPSSPETPARKKSYYKGPIPLTRDFVNQTTHDARWTCTFTVVRVVKNLEDEHAPETNLADLFVLYVVLLEACVVLRDTLPHLADAEVFGATTCDMMARVSTLQLKKGFSRDATVAAPQDILVAEAIYRCRIAFELEGDRSEGAKAKLELAKEKYSEAKACLYFVYSFLLAHEDGAKRLEDIIERLEDSTERPEDDDLQGMIKHMIMHISRRIKALTTKLG